MRLSIFAPLIAIAAPAAAQDHRAALDSLLAADRAFSAQAAQAQNAAAGLAPMFDADLFMIVGGRPVQGRDAVAAALAASPNYSEGRVSWTPVRGGVSADGRHGFTFGYATFDGGPPLGLERKYLAYWVQRPEGWRVVAYRQSFRQPGEISRALRPPSLPGEPLPGSEADHQASLAAAEQAFSDRAQQVGLRAAFAEFGRADAVNINGPQDFVYGAEAISRIVDQGQPVSPVRWSMERGLVAGSGDLGLSIGTIHRNGPVPEGQPASFPFFTIWRRDGPGQPWRYVAE